MPLRRINVFDDAMLSLRSQMSFAAKDVAAGEPIETAPVVPVIEGQEPHCHMLRSGGAMVLIPWMRAEEKPTLATVLGTMPRYGLSEDFNVELVPDYQNRVVTSYAVTNIAAGEHLIRQQLLPPSLGFITETPPLLRLQNLPDEIEVNPVYIADGQWGLGGFAARGIAYGELVEAAPVMKVRSTDLGQGLAADWGRYWFHYGGIDRGGSRVWMEPKRRSAAMALGYGGIYNHSYAPNIAPWKEYSAGVLEFIALRDIAEGEELYQNYGWPADDERFTV